MLTSLPRTQETGTPAWPEVYSDHFLFHEDLHQPYHCQEHRSALGLLMTDKGACNYFINGRRHQVQGHQVFLVNRESRLAMQTAHKESAPALLFFHSGLPDLVRYSLDKTDEVLLEENNTSEYFDFSFLERLHDNPALSRALQTLIQLGSSCSSFAALKADIMIRNLFEQLLIENRSARHLAKNITVVKYSTRLEIFKRLSTARDWMEANCCSRITLPEMAAIANMNSQHFLRMFRQLYRCTPHQYLINCRLEKARQLLQLTDLPVTEICNRIGFESVQSFTLLFRKKFGMPPRKFSIFDKSSAPPQQ